MKILPPLEEEDTMLSALSYPFWYVTAWFVFFSRKKDEPFVKFHTIQSIAFGLAMSAGYLLLIFMLVGIFHCVPSLRKIIHEQGFVWKGYMAQGFFMVAVFLVFLLLFFVGLSLILYYSNKAWKGEYFKIPFIGQRIEDRYFSYLRDDVEQEAAGKPPQAHKRDTVFPSQQ
ncbi:MAG: DUF4870 domain-containing protein [Candidatus Eremiobacteraeota bacterium]|nr:DUF4870 domain-containing protein [Candidatus Eremiobacteraeota bacterium]